MVPTCSSGNKTVNQAFKAVQVVLTKFNAYKCRLPAGLTWPLSYFKESLSVNIQLSAGFKVWL